MNNFVKFTLLAGACGLISSLAGLGGALCTSESVKAYNQLPKKNDNNKAIQTNQTAQN